MAARVAGGDGAVKRGGWAMVGNSGDSRAERRQTLATLATPAPWHDCRVRWIGTLADGTVLTVEYVPDRLLLAAAAFPAYLESLQRTAWPALEGLTTTVLDDLNNQLVPRWVRVSGRFDADGVRHHATVNDRQPGWDNPGLIPAPGRD